MREAIQHTEDMVQRTLSLLERPPKLFGRLKPPEKSKSEPMSSSKFRKATTESMSASVKRSTMSSWRRASQLMKNTMIKKGPTSTHDLEQIVFLKLLKHTALDLDELIRDQEGQERMVVRVDGNVECDHLVHHHQRMSHCMPTSIVHVYACIDNTDHCMLVPV
jgi:hypothetical protein